MKKTITYDVNKKTVQREIDFGINEKDYLILPNFSPNGLPNPREEAWKYH